MALSPGMTLGTFEIIAPLGAGGMGEVYRARDTRLQRDVALKLLPETFASDPDRIARFEREAHTLAALNHPHIAQVYGFERTESSQALVMELVEGEDLSTLIASGAGNRETGTGLPIDEALAIAKQIAEALEAAHGAGIIHRDLKPANIKVRADGTVKVLDFGLAKALEPSLSTSADHAASPTITSPAQMTQAGMILGTAAYMSPEQAKGKPADKRSDIWAFGCILYEMLAGGRPFGGDDVADTLAAVLRAAPDWSRLPTLPHNIRQLLQRALEKDRGKRLSDVSIVRYLLSEDPQRPAEARHHGGRSVFALVAAGVAIAAVAVAATLWWKPSPPLATTEAVQRFSITLPANFRFTTSPGAGAGINLPPLAVSPDGKWLVVGAMDRDGRRGLWLRGIALTEWRYLEGSDGARYPFWAPDSRSVAFGTQGDLKIVNISGGRAERLLQLDNFTGGTWAADGTIIVGLSGQGFIRTSINGAPAEKIEFDGPPGFDARFPQFLPGDHQFIFWGRSEGVAAAIYLGTLGQTHVTRLVDSARAGFYSAGRLLFVRGQTLNAQKLSPESYLPIGTPQTLPDRIGTSQSGYTAASSSTTGLLLSAAGQISTTQPTWVDETGNVIDTFGDPRPRSALFLSHDKRRVLMTITNEATGLPSTWTYELDRRRESKVSDGTNAVLSPDSQSVAYRSPVEPIGLSLSSITGTRATSLRSGTGFPSDWSPDGRSLLLMSPEPGRQFDVSLMDLSTRTIKPLVHTPAGEGAARFSPDGRWVAYVSDQSQRMEVYAFPLSEPENRTVISTGGGFDPLWSDDGKELFYLTPTGVLTSVAVTLTGNRLTAGSPRGLFRLADVLGEAFFGGRYAVGSNRRFLINRPTGDSGSTIGVVVNWPGALTSTP